MEDLKQFIKNYDFAVPNWDNVPSDFPACNTQELTYQEKLIWDGILVAWYTSHPWGYVRENGLKIVAATSSFAFVAIFITMLLYYAQANFNIGLTFLTNFFA